LLEFDTEKITDVLELYVFFMQNKGDIAVGIDFGCTNKGIRDDLIFETYGPNSLSLSQMDPMMVGDDKVSGEPPFYND